MRSVLCSMCKKYKLPIKFRAENTICHTCSINYLSHLSNKDKHDIKRSIDYKYVFDNLNAKPYYNCFVSDKLFDELCAIDKRFKHINKTITDDGFILFNDKRYEWLVINYVKN